MTYSHTKRSGVAFVFLGIITLGIYPIVVLSKVRKEVASLLDGKGVDPQIPFVWGYLLGFLTLGIVPLIWICRMANKIQMAALEKRITSPRLSGSYMFWLGYIGTLFLAGPFLAFHRFFALLNKVESSANFEAEERAKLDSAKKEMLEQVRGQSNGESPAESPAELQTVQSPYPNLPEQHAEEKEEKKEPSWKTASPSPADAKWRVRVGKSEVRSFTTKAEAVAFAKSLLAERRALDEAKAKKE